jgi:hypothetical protein
MTISRRKMFISAAVGVQNWRPANQVRRPRYTSGSLARLTSA